MEASNLGKSIIYNESSNALADTGIRQILLNTVAPRVKTAIGWHRAVYLYFAILISYSVTVTSVDLDLFLFYRLGRDRVPETCVCLQKLMNYEPWH